MTIKHATNQLRSRAARYRRAAKKARVETEKEIEQFGDSCDADAARRLEAKAEAIEEAITLLES